MGGVVSAVEDTISSAVDTVGTVAADTLKAADTVVTDVVKPVATAVDNTIKSAINDPVGTIAKLGTAAVAPELLPVVTTADALAHGANLGNIVTNLAANTLTSGLASDVGTDVTSATDSSVLGNIARAATSGASNAALTGKDPLTAGLSAAINNGVNSEVANLTGIKGLPSVNVASQLLGNTGSAVNKSIPTQGSQTTKSPLPNSPVYDVASASTMPQLGLQNIGLPNLSLGNLSLASLGNQGASELQTKVTDQQSNAPTPLKQMYASLNLGDSGATTLASGGTASTKSSGLSVPKISDLDKYTQLDQTVDPTEDLVYQNRLVTPTQYGLLSAEPVTFSAEGGEVHDAIKQLIPEMMHMLTKRMASGGRAEIEEMITPTFAKEAQPHLLVPQGRGAIPRVGALSQSAESQHLGTGLQQMSEGPLSSMLHKAHGGLSKYAEAAPDGHKPEFITGITGYYAGGRGTGQSDDIDAMLHDGDYVMDADTVSALGDGSSKAGNEALMHFMHQVPHHKGVGEGHPVPAKIADGEVVFPEPFVTALGGGDNKAGAKLLDKMREELRSHKRSAPTTKIPPKAKTPLEYLKMAKG